MKMNKSETTEMLEALLLEYIEKYGLTENARAYFVRGSGKGTDEADATRRND